MLQPDVLARWAELTPPTSRRRRHRGYQPALPGWEPVRSGTIPSESERVENWVLFEHNAALVRIDVTECADWQDAQLCLLEIANGCMSPYVNVTAGLDAELVLGDVRFTARVDDRLTAATFTSGNLCVSVASVSRYHVDIEEDARRIDEELRSLDV